LLGRSSPCCRRLRRARLDALLNFFAVPTAYWIKVRSTNVIERAFREVRRRTRPMSSFANRQSCDRIVFGVISHLNGLATHPITTH
jgi:transposase-like protein